MLLRLVSIRNKKLLYCSNGSIIECSPDTLRDILLRFDKPSSFKGANGYWNMTNSDMEDAPGMTLAFVDDKKRLVVLNSHAFEDVCQSIKYISVAEYAEKHNKGIAIIKRLCAEGRLDGAYRTTSGWLIPENAKYPERKNKKEK